LSTFSTPTSPALASAGAGDTAAPQDGERLQLGSLDYRQPGTVFYGTGTLYYGLTLVAWLKIGVIAILMIALYRFNLTRLWLKTNPINGEGNWEHAS